MATRTDCLKALALHEEALSKLKNVVGLGLVETEREQTDDGSPRVELAVAVYVRRKVPPGELAPRQRIPAFLVVPSAGGEREVAVRVLEQGSVELEDPLFGG